MHVHVTLLIVLMPHVYKYNFLTLTRLRFAKDLVVQTGDPSEKPPASPAAWSNCSHSDFCARTLIRVDKQRKHEEANNGKATELGMTSSVIFGVV